jgi:hypothetical protein
MFLASYNGLCPRFRRTGSFTQGPGGRAVLRSPQKGDGSGVVGAPVAQQNAESQ